MNILFTNSKGLGHGGAEVSIMQYIEELERRGHNVVIASSKDFKEIKTERIKSVEKWPFFLREFYLKRKFTELIDKYSIDLITSQDNITTISAILAARKCSIPVLVHIRDNWFACPRSSCLRPDYSECVHCDAKLLMSCSSWYRYPLDLYKWRNIKRSWELVDNADAKVCVSSAVKSKLAKCGITHNVNVVPGARVLEEFENVEGVEEFKKKYELRKIVITFIGSFFYTKGVLQIFKFMPDILKFNPDVSLMLVGDGPLYGDVVILVKENGIEKQV
ncbi:MAG: glycosyltransferase family 4 protein, partial [Nanoarchaeota archaeon]